MNQHNVQRGPAFWTLLPVVPLIEKDGEEVYNLLDARTLGNASGKSVTVVFRLKQTAVHFMGKEQPQRMIERISIEPSIIAVIFDPRFEKTVDYIRPGKKRRVTSF